MRRRALLPALGISLTMLALGVTAGDRHRTIRAFAELVPANEVPSVSSGAHGFFKATIDRASPLAQRVIRYRSEPLWAIAARASSNAAARVVAASSTHSTPTRA